MEDKDKMIQALNDRIGIHSIEECLEFPKYFEIETINLCNARCKMCTVERWTGEDRQDRKRTMSVDVFQKFIDEIRHYTDWIETIALQRNGEPTLDKGLIDKIRKLKKSGLKMSTW